MRPFQGRNLKLIFLFKFVKRKDELRSITPWAEAFNQWKS